jgi:hypothetical protein
MYQDFFLAENCKWLTINKVRAFADT